jgi:hypothetical protein
MKWWLLIIFGVLLVDCVSAEILNEKNERECNGNKCWVNSYNAEVFPKLLNKYWYFNEIHDITPLDNLGTRYSYADGTIVTMVPMVEIDGKIKELNTVPTISDTPLKYVSIITKERDQTKFKIEFDNIIGLSRIGFRVLSNQPIKYIDYEYLKSGIYDNENPPYYHNVTDLQILDTRLSFVDLIENGYNIEFDKLNNILWIDLTDKPNTRLEADPTQYRFAKTTDGYFQVQSPNTCIRVPINS